MNTVSNVNNAFKNPIDKDIQPLISKAVKYLNDLLDTDVYETDQFYDAVVFLGELGEISEEQLDNIIAALKEEERAYKGYEDDIYLFEGRDGIFWNSYHGLETTDCISRYRFLEYFNIGGFDNTKQSIEKVIVSYLHENTDDISVVHDLWLTSKSSELCGKVRPFIDIVLTSVANMQLVEGWWRCPNIYYTREELPFRPGNIDYGVIKKWSETAFIPSIRLTAKAVLSLLKLSRQYWQSERALAGVNWLVKQQKADGYWSAKNLSYRNPALADDEEPDLVTTLIVLECIRLSGLEGMGHYLDLGESWVISQQLKDGSWEGYPRTYPLRTVLVTEYFYSIDRFDSQTKMPRHLDMAKYFLSRSREFKLEDNPNSQRLAIITAFQGFELFLYASLSHKTIGISIYEGKGYNKTVGVEKAFNKLSIYFQKKIPPSSERLERSNWIDDLIYFRGEIVHKGASIENERCAEIIEGTIEFVNKYSKVIFGFRLI